MPKFVKIEAEADDDVLFVCFGALKAGQDAANSILVKESESIEGVITEIKVSPKYGNIYQLQVKKQPKPVLITGKTDLNKKMAAGKIKAGDLVRITFINKTKTTKGNSYYNFDVEVAQ
jgi:hypothetical protein